VSVTATDLPLHHLDADRYALIVASGALDDQRVELIDGIITQMSPQSPEHAALIRRLIAHFRACADRLLVQLPLRLSDDSVPEPDLAIVAHDEDPRSHPASALLVVEVAHSSHRLDQGRKSVLYAQAGVPDYWLVDVPGRGVHWRSLPSPDGYQAEQVYGLGTELPAPADVPGVPALDIAELFRGF
jgi:Uma2 family endonuclease